MSAPRRTSGWVVNNCPTTLLTCGRLPNLRSSEGSNPLVIWSAGHALDKVRLKDSLLSVLLTPLREVDRWVQHGKNVRIETFCYSARL